MLADSELTVTNKCSDVDGPPLKVFLGRSHILLPCGMGCGHYRLGFAMWHAFLVSCDKVEFHIKK